MSKRLKVLDTEKAKKIADISADLVDMDSTIAEITTVILSSNVTPEVKTTLCVMQQKTSIPQPLEKMEIPPLMLPPQLAANPSGAALYLRQVIEADKKAMSQGKIPAITETLAHIHIDLEEEVVFKVLCVIRDHYAERRVLLSNQLHELIKPAKNAV